MSFRSDRFRPPADLRVRPVPELGYCLVFTPSCPRLFTLNAAAWLLLELCSGQEGGTLDAEFRAALTEQDPFSTSVPDTQFIVEDLEAKGILLRQPGKEQVT